MLDARSLGAGLNPVRPITPALGAEAVCAAMLAGLCRAISLPKETESNLGTVIACDVTCLGCGGIKKRAEKSKNEYIVRESNPCRVDGNDA